LYKTVYDGAFFRVQLGPFFDTAAIADPSGLFGSQKWLFDTGIQAVSCCRTAAICASGTGVLHGASVH
jgi:hypothetical protein